MYSNKKRSTSETVNFSYSSCSINLFYVETDFKKKLSELKPYRYSYYEKGNNQYTMKSSFLTLIDKEKDI